jgi:teneurin
LVNGGGAITLQFQRSPFRPLTRTVFVPWNQISVLPPVQMKLVDESDSKMPKVGMNIAYSFLNALQYKFYDGNANDSSVICPDHNHELLRPILTSTWMPNAIGSLPGRSAIFAENQVSRFCCRYSNPFSCPTTFCFPPPPFLPFFFVSSVFVHSLMTNSTT